MTALLSVVERSRENLLLAEEYLTRVTVAGAEPGMAPPAAGGAL